MAECGRKSGGGRSGLAAMAALAAGLSGVIWGGPAAAAGVPDARCTVPDGAAGSPAPLVHAAAALHAGGTLDVLVVGSATVFGPEAAMAAGAAAREAAARGIPPGTGAVPTGDGTGAAPGSSKASDTAFPMVMGRVLEQAVPGAKVHVTVRGARSMSAADMVDVMRSAIASHPYQLVIWQTGTLEAVRNVQPGDFAQTLADGEQVAKEAGADLVLVDPQYSRFLQTNANLDPYLQAFGTAAGVADVVWFKRYDLMREWVGNGQIDLEHTAKGDRKAAVELLHRCLGNELAGLVALSVRS